MARLITCFEHESLPVRAKVLAGEKALSIAQAEELEKIKSIPAGAFQRTAKTIKWQQFCGVVQLDGLTLEILPKVYGEPSVEEARLVLHQMLSKAGFLRVYSGSSARVSLSKQSLLDVFILEFCRLVTDQDRLGRPKDYKAQEENLGVLKGRLLLKEHLQANLISSEKIFCQFDEFTDDLLLQQIIKFCLKILQKGAKSQLSVQAVNRLLMQYADISDKDISLGDLDRVFFDRNTSRYREVLAWCRVFLEGYNPSASAGKSNLISIMFDMNRLFEAWVFASLKPLLAKNNFILKAQSGRKYLANRLDLGMQVFMTQPDLIITNRQNEVLMILDTKWKVLKHQDLNLGVQQSDMYQMMSYAQIYEVPQLALIYPQVSRDFYKDYQLAINSSIPVNLSIYTVELAKGVEELCSLVIKKLSSNARNTVVF